MVKVITGAVCGVVVFVLILAAAAVSAVAGVFGGGGGGCGTLATGATDAVGLTAEQSRNAAVIVAVGKRMQVPPRGYVVAIATALQESELVNLGNLGTNNDHDSLGLFQQRPSQGWGTPEQVMNPEYASTKFYEHLLKVSDWQSMSVTMAAQSVQKSAFPDAYAKHEARAVSIVAGVGGAVLTGGGCGGTVSPSGWVAPVTAPITSPYGDRDGVLHAGTDLGAAEGSPVRAASSGVVVEASCNATLNGSPYSCDVPGSIAVSGCGWHVEIKHAGNIVTRYCHFLRQPSVKVGQPVVAGQTIGVVGTSGNSSGVHLHFETHTGYPANNGNSTDAVPFMAARGVKLGSSN